MRAADAKPFVIERRADRICVGGELVLANAASVWRELRAATAATAGERGDRLDIDLAAVRTIDGSVVALLIDVRAALASRGVASDLVGASDHVAELLGLYQGRRGPVRAAAPPKLGVIERIGSGTERLLVGAKRMTEFVGASVANSVGALVRPITANWRSVFSLVGRAGTDAVPLVLILNFLLGFVMGYESSRQLERYGAKLFIADVVAIAVTRELSPVMTSIIVLGRSAAAYTAELATMKVSEELDAIRTMGMSPIRQLVLPRVLALLVVTPLLTLLGDIAGVAGGALVGHARLDVTPRAYLIELRQAIVPLDVVAGAIKAAVAGLTMATIGCAQGFATTGGPSGVGRRTTSTVVKSLVALIVIDAFFAVFLRMVGA